MRAKKLLLFDFDGTLADNSEGIFASIRHAVGKMGLGVPSPEVLRTFVGPSLHDSFLRVYGGTEEEALEFVRLYREFFQPTGSNMAVLYPGMKALLRRFRDDGYRLAFCSSKPYQFVTKISKALGIFDLFDACFAPGFSASASDKTGLLLEGLAHFGVKKEEALMIGDTKFDVEAAKAAGVESLGVRYGFSSPGELEAAGADCLADTVWDVYRLVTGLPLWKSCVIFGAGDPPGTCPAFEKDALLVAADGGLLTMRSFGLTPDLFVGDLDSLPEGAPEGIEALRLPVKKDVTDTDAAAVAALERGCTDVLILGGTGGRLDHTLANLSLLARLSQKGCRARLSDGKTTAQALTNGSLTLPARESGTVSVFSFTEKSEGVTVRGLQYALEDASLVSSFALGVSNAFAGKDAFIGVKNGTLLVLYPDDLS